MKLAQGVFVLLLTLLLTVSACRRNQPSLVDTNEAPDTELWYAPPDSTEYEYLVHLFWRGRDADGTVERFIWTRKDTLVLEQDLVWNPSARLRDFREGRITSRTDSVFAFTAFTDVGGVGVKKNRQAFHIASIDDNGIIDPTPAAIEFVATIDELPEVQFHTRIRGSQNPYRHQQIPGDTVGVGEGFEISWSGETQNGQIREYQYFPLNLEVNIPGSREWYTNLTDTTRVFTNTGSDQLPSGVFRFAAKCRDDAGAESAVDGGTYVRGVAQVVVNFDPQTTLNRLQSTYTFNGGLVSEDIDFTDSVLDTLPYRSWATLYYSGVDDPRDAKVCDPPSIDPDQCLDFQIKVDRTSTIKYPNPFTPFSTSGWRPPKNVTGFHDTDAFSASDSNTVSVGSFDYLVGVRTVDELDKEDGTPATVNYVGNHSPAITSLTLEDHNGNVYAPGDTVKWNFWRPKLANPGDIPSVLTDTVDIADSDFPFVRTFEFSIKGTGADNARDVRGGIKSWLMRVTDANTGARVTMGRSGSYFEDFNAMQEVIVNQLDETISVTFRYGSFLTSEDPLGDAVFALPPSFVNRDLKIVLVGRDTSSQEPDFDEIVYINGDADLINSVFASQFGRIAEQEFTLYVSFFR